MNFNINQLSFNSKGGVLYKNQVSVPTYTGLFKNGHFESLFLLAQLNVASKEEY